MNEDYKKQIHQIVTSKDTMILALEEENNKLKD